MSIPVLTIPVLNRFDLLRQSLATIDHPIDEILIINNSGNSAETAGLREEFPHLPLRILDFPSNFGVPASWNLGIKLYPHAPYWTFSAADTQFLPGAMQRMEEVSGGNLLITADVAGFNFFSVGEEIVDKVGLFDEYFYPIYFEDLDYVARCIQAGYMPGVHQISPGVKVADTPQSQTLSDGALQQKNEHTFAANRTIYHAKYEPGPEVHVDETLRALMKQVIGWKLQRRREHEWMS